MMPYFLKMTAGLNSVRGNLMRRRNFMSLTGGYQGLMPGVKKMPAEEDFTREFKARIISFLFSVTFFQ